MTKDLLAALTASIEAAKRERPLTPSRRHHLTVTRGEDFNPEHPHFVGTVTCLIPALCDGWQECLQTHEVDGIEAHDGPWDAPEGAPWADEDYFEFHGETHQWLWHGWSTPYPGCVVADNDAVSDCAHDIGLALGEGTYAVRDEWHDEQMTLVDVERVEVPR